MFIVFEGIDGSGKTTQANLIAKTLHNLGYEVISTREPGGTDFAEKIRELIFSCKENLLMCEILLFTASRYDHYIKVIYPAILEKKIVICDRFIASTLAYQTSFSQNTKEDSLCDNKNHILPNQHIAMNFIIDLHKLVFQKFFQETNILVSDCTFFLDISLNIALKRMQKKDKFENRGEHYYKAVINNYKKLEQQVKNYYIISADRKKREVTIEIMSKLLPLLNSHESLLRPNK